LGAFPSSFTSGNFNVASVSPSLHVVRVGLTHYFGDDWSAPAAATMYTKAPPVPVYTWTAFYTGFSVGAGGMHTQATTVQSSPKTTTQTVAPLGGPPNLGITQQNFDNTTITGGDGFRPGGVADLFTGFNQQLGSWVAGVQLEGSVARFNERLARVSSSTNGS